jgi:hypothetical protein
VDGAVAEEVERPAEGAVGLDEIAVEVDRGVSEGGVVVEGW